VCSSSFSSSSSSVCSSLGSYSGLASAPTHDEDEDEDEEQEESKEEEEGQQQQQQYQEAEVEVDPITLEPLGPASDTFTLCLPQQRGLVVRYNLETLARYLVASGRFVEVRCTQVRREMLESIESMDRVVTTLTQLPDTPTHQPNPTTLADVPVAVGPRRGGGHGAAAARAWHGAAGAGGGAALGVCGRRGEVRAFVVRCLWLLWLRCVLC
jgi:hypothetical protein